MVNNIYEGHRDLSPNVLISENTNNAFPRHFHRNLEILYIRKGIMKAQINDIEFDCHEDEIVFVPSYYAHEFSTPQESDVLVILIPYTMLSDFNDLFAKSRFEFLLKDKSYNRNIREILELLLKTRDNYNQYVLKGFLDVILGLLINRYPTTQEHNNRNMTLIIDILQYIEQNYANDISLELIAKQFNYNKYYISRIFNHYVGKNFKYYINSVRVQHLVSLYNANQNANPNISSLAMLCGFENTATFYRAFREIYNTSPKSFFMKINTDFIEYNVLSDVRM